MTHTGLPGTIACRPELARWLRQAVAVNSAHRLVQRKASAAASNIRKTLPAELPRRVAHCPLGMVTKGTPGQNEST